jgi:hypothetical protein
MQRHGPLQPSWTGYFLLTFCSKLPQVLILHSMCEGDACGMSIPLLRGLFPLQASHRRSTMKHPCHGWSNSTWSMHFILNGLFAFTRLCMSLPSRPPICGGPISLRSGITPRKKERGGWTSNIYKKGATKQHEVG